MKTETIAAIASGLTTSGIGIIRVSGAEALKLADVAMGLSEEKSLEKGESHRVKYGFIYDGDEIIDEVLAIVMKAPRSYTGEDVVEIQCHGGPYIMKKLLDRVIALGARLAEPGEFTKRAFLNGRIDLSQAESVMDLIASESETARVSALSGLRGELKEEISAMRQKLIYETAYLEAALDDPEHISLEGYGSRLGNMVGELTEKLSKMIERAEDGRVLKEGIKTVILGRPNAGKSTLLNLFSGEDRAIVTSIPGTTRDILEEKIRLSDLTLVLVDTAGLRQSEDEVENIGVRRALQAAESADLILYMIDGNSGITAEDKEEISKLAGKTVIFLVNKIDRGLCLSKEEYEKKLGAMPVFISAKSGEGREDLEKRIKELFYSEVIVSGESRAIANSRQKEALMAAKNALIAVKEAIDGGLPEDLYTVDLMDAYTALGKITGESVSDDLANEIFSKFCMGK